MVRGYVTDPVDVSGLYIWSSDNVELSVTDSSGRRTGYDPKTAVDVSEIPNVFYSRNAMTDRVSGQRDASISRFLDLPGTQNTALSLTVTVLSPGAYNVFLSAYAPEGFKHPVSVLSGTVASGSIATYQLQYAPSSGTLAPPLLANVSGLPTADSATPASGNAPSQPFTFQFSDPDGWQDLGVLNVLINNAIDGRQACYLAYSRPSNLLYLVPDSGTGLLPGLVLNGTGTVSNSQCTVTGSGSSVSGSGNTLTLTLNLSFGSAFGGNKLLYLAARDTAENNSGWQLMGVHGVPPTSSKFPVSASVNPPSGTGSSSVLTYTYQDQTSANGLETTWALINNALDGAGACYVAYYRPGNLLLLLPDNGNASQATSMVLNGGSTSLSNSQCTILGSGSSASVNGNQLSVTLNTVFKPAFAGRKGVWLGAATLSGQSSNWQALGVWQVPGN